MKKYLFILCCITAIAFAGCEKETKDEPNKKPDGSDNTPTATNYLEYEGTKYDLDKAFFEITSFAPGVRGFKINVVSSGVTYNATTQGLTGTGNGVTFTLTTTSTVPPIPVATFSPAGDGDSRYVLSNTRITIAEDFSTGYPTVPAHDGSLKITKDGSNYVLEYSGKDNQNSAVKCYFKGAINQIN